MSRDCTDLQDYDVIRRILDGEINSFASLLEKYKDHVGMIVSNHVPNGLVEEIAHNVFVKAYFSLHTFKHKTTFKQWLSAIAVRTCYDYWRKFYRSRELPMSSLEEEDEHWLETIMSDQSQEALNEDASRREIQELVDWALSRLSPEDRMVLELVHLEDYSVKEAAALLGWSTANVKVRAHRSRKKMHNLLQSREETTGGNHET